MLGMDFTGGAKIFGERQAQYRIAAFVRNAEAEDRSTNATTYQASANLTAGLADGWTGRASTLYRDTENRVGADATAGEATLGLTRRLSIAEWIGSATGGVTGCHSKTGNETTTDFGLDFFLQATRDEHSFSASLRTLEQQVDPSVNDVATTSAALNYLYQLGPHRVSLEGRYDQRAPDATANTDAYKLSICYAFRFQAGSNTALSAADPALAFGGPATGAA